MKVPNLNLKPNEYINIIERVTLKIGEKKNLSRKWCKNHQLQLWDRKVIYSAI